MTTVEQLELIRRTVEYMRELEGQSRNYVIDMSQVMITDVIETNGLAPMIDYVNQYCDVADSDEDRERIAAEILAAAERL